MGLTHLEYGWQIQALLTNQATQGTWYIGQETWVQAVSRGEAGRCLPGKGVTTQPLLSVSWPLPPILHPLGLRIQNRLELSGADLQARRGSVQGTRALAMHSWAQLAPASLSEAPPPDPCPGTKCEVRQGGVPGALRQCSCTSHQRNARLQVLGEHAPEGGGSGFLAAPSQLQGGTFPGVQET